MAAYMIRLGRLRSLKCLQQGSWGVLRTPVTSAFCTKTEEPQKPAKKAKAADKTLKASEERAALLSYKTAVAFPTRLAPSGIITECFALGKTELNVHPESGEPACSADTTIAETSSTCQDSAKASSPEDAGVERINNQVEQTASPVGGTTTKNQEGSSSSSSSSSSDSDSDSDSDDDEKQEKTKDKTEKTETVVQRKVEARKELPSAVGEKSAPEMKTTKFFAEGVTSEAVPVKKTAHGSSTEEGSQVAKAATSKDVCSKSNEITVSPEEAAVETVAPASTSAEIMHEKAKEESEIKCITDQATAKVIPGASTDVLDTTPKAATEGSPGIAATPEPLKELKEVPLSKVEAKFVPVSAAKIDAEELVDPATVITDMAEPAAKTAAAPQEAAPAPEPELLDNTTYKNLQHHNYNIYTFVDMDVVMAKNRLPQPSTGRPSPMD